jgi:hypothetical protein
MILNNEQPIIIPATEEKQFPHLWLKNIRIDSNSVDQGMIMISAAPYNSLTKEIGGGTVKNIHVRDLWKAVQEVPEVAVAMNAILAAVEPLDAWNKLQLEIPPYVPYYAPVIESLDV